jgi:hypothetical protein
MIFQAGFRFELPDSQGYLLTIFREEKVLKKN